MVVLSHNGSYAISKAVLEASKFVGQEINMGSIKRKRAWKHYIHYLNFYLNERKVTFTTANMQIICNLWKTTSRQTCNGRLRIPCIIW